MPADRSPGYGPCLYPGCKLAAAPGEHFCVVCVRLPDVQLKLAEARAMAAARAGKFAGKA